MTRDKEKNREWKRKYYEEHKEEIAEYNRKYNADPIHRFQATKKSNAWAKRNPDKVRESNKKRYDPQKDRERKLRKNYGISIDEYDIMYNIQHGKCKICHIHQSELKKPLFVDHDHNNGIIRGLICHRCNFALGLFDDDIEKLQEAINYLKGE